MGQVIIMLGPPGAGKGTQAEILARRLGGVHLSSGAALRGSSDPDIRQILDSGGLVKSDDVIRVMEKAINQIPAEQAIILDGTSRKLGEAKHWLEWLPPQGRQIKAVIHLDVPEQEAVKRNLKRGRADDTIEAQRKRWELYENETKPALEMYRRLRLVKEVNGVGSVDEVAERVAGAL